ncbi:MAG: SDR family NAD(P)-dependent oxidoreductase [Chthonomonadales bacterium]
MEAFSGHCGLDAGLAGRAALVTGSSRGIGAAIARALAACGVRVMIHYNRDEAAAREVLAALPGTDHGIIQADVADPAECRKLVDASLEHLGGLDVVVNNAGIYEKQPFTMEEYTLWLEAWKRTLDTNLMSAVNITYCILPHMLARGRGKIINIASRAAFRGETDAPAYAVSKAGMVIFTRCLARALSAGGVYAYGIAPGWVETAMAREGMETMRESILAEIPVGRIATPEDVAHVAVFLASDAADYLTGITIDVNGASYLH